MSEPTSEANGPREENIVRLLRSVWRRLGWLMVAVLVMMLFWMVTIMTIFGSLATYFGGDPLFLGGCFIATALVGFGFGFIAGRWAWPPK